MFDIELISKKDLQELSNMYWMLKRILKEDPTCASKRRQEKICKQMKQFYEMIIDEFPTNLREYMLGNTNVAELFCFLKECSKKMEAYEQEKQQQIEEATINLSKEVKDAIAEWLEEVWVDVTMISEQKDIKVCINQNLTYSRYLILKDVDGVPFNPNREYLRNCGFMWLPEEKRYCLYGELEEEDSIYPFRFTFSDVKVEVQCYNGIEEYFASRKFKKPWEFLNFIASDMEAKADFSKEYCNEKELVLLPLFQEIKYLIDWYPVLEKKKIKFPLLKNLFIKYNYMKLVSIITAIENTFFGSWKYKYFMTKLIAKLCEKKYEPLWREIFNQLEASQREYPKNVELQGLDKVLIEKRNQIQKKMEEEGFTGIYPDFVKKGEMSKLNLVESYGMPYLVGKRKNVEYRIHCFETIECDEYVSINFLCGTIFECQSENDIYSCLFDANGKRLFHTVRYNIPFDKEDKEAEELASLLGIISLEDCISVAIKKAELLPLTKEERKQYYGTAHSNVRLFFSILFLAGGLFASFMTVGFMVLTILTTLLAGEIHLLAEVFWGIPWGWGFLALWIGFGFPMAIITVWAMRI